MSCSSDDQSDKECPLCMEALEIDDIDFYPCKCEYQICRFCWHRIRTDENGLCPACRQPYPENPVNFKPLSTADLKRITGEKKMKNRAEKKRVSDSRKHLANYRVLQKNLVYVVGLSQRVAIEDVLRKPEYFGRYGKILKIVTGSTANSSLPHIPPSYTAYVTYSRIEEALVAIQAVNNAQLDGRTVKASLGTTKYCSSYLRTQSCGKPECMYLHDIADDDISFTKEDMHLGKHTEYERRLIDTVLSKRNNAQRQSTWSSKQPVCWDQSTREVVDDTNSSEAGYNTVEAEPLIEDPTPSEAKALQSGVTSNVRENATLKPTKASGKKTKSSRQRTPSPPSEPTPPPQDILSESDEDNSTLISAEEQLVQDDPVVDEVDQCFVEATAIEQPIENTDLMKPSLFSFMQHEPPIRRGTVPAPASRDEAPAPLMNWQALLGLTPTCTTTAAKHVPGPPPGLPSLFADDDLGFDPFSESTKGLAQLLEEERIRHPPSALPRSESNSFGSNNQSTFRDLWQRQPQYPSLHSNNNSSAPFDLFSLSQPSSFLGNAHSSHSNGHSVNDFSHLFQTSQSNGQNFGHSSSIHGHGSSYAPPPGLVPPRQPNGQQSMSSRTQSILEWQEGLKALLPNVNVRFAPDIDQHEHHQTQNQMNSLRWQQSSFNTAMPHQVPPPPGFSVPNR